MSALCVWFKASGFDSCVVTTYVFGCVVKCVPPCFLRFGPTVVVNLGHNGPVDEASIIDGFWLVFLG